VGPPPGSAVDGPARPVKRVYIPKADGKRRPLGISVIVDRVLQARVVNALEPEWEARFEPRSYGFRPGRGCHDAIGAIFQVAKGANPARQWVLDADLTAAFDRIDHRRLLDTIGEFPVRERIAGWLKAGVVESGLFAATEAGTPQGGVISPLLLNVALHGMEHAAGARYGRVGPRAAAARRNSPVLIRYADDLVAFCHSRQPAEQIKAQLVAWLRPRGLAFNEDKTRIACLDEGFDFLGFTVRRYRGTLLITPSKQAVRRIRERLRTEMRSLRGTNAEAVIARLNPIIRGWVAYYRNVVSSKVFTDLDHYMWQLTYKWARRTHPNKPTRWIVRRYFGVFNKSRRDRWVFGDRVSGAYLLKFAWTRIVRHQMVTGTASPDGPALTDYWKTPSGTREYGCPSTAPGCGCYTPSTVAAHDADSYSCTPTTRHKPRRMGTVAGGHPQGDHQDSITLRERAPDRSDLRLIHTHCHPQQPGTPSARQGLA
jgi:RNA-directed DNA polymerase